MADPYREIDASTAGEPSPEVTFWSKEIDFAKKREKRFRQEAEDVVKLYEAQRPEANSFNILYSNTETLLPAVYNQTPRPIVERRFHDSDPLALHAANTMERTLQYLVDSPDQEYEQYDDLFRQAALGALVPGRGVTWFKYDPKIEDSAASVGDREGAEGEAGDTKLADEQENTGEIYPQAGGKVTWETVCGEDIDYDKFLCGYARRWVNVPWAAREHAMSRDDAEENFGEAIAEELEYLSAEADGSMGGKTKDASQNQGSTETAVVYEIWWKQEKKVVFYAPSLKSKLCLELDDPYGITGFFPCAEPLQFLHKRSTLVPTPLYKAYEPQAKELNRITQRISRILNALKVRGFYDGTLQGLKELLSAEDNTLIPAKNVAAMQQGQNVQNSVWFMPLEVLIKVLRELYTAQELCKNVIYEITGIADIMRGSSQVSETATAQSLKDKWGGLRLQNMQGALQSYIRDCLRIVGELAGRHFGIETFAGMTNLDYATPQELEQAQQLIAQINQAMSQMPPPQQAAPPPPGAPAAGPPPAPQLPPQIAQAQQQVQAIMAKPKWEEVLALLKDNLHRGYKIDIETNSTLANTSSEDQQNITNAMGAIAQALQQFIPAVQTGVMTMPAVKEILLSIARRFEFGRQVEQSIAMMPDQLPPPPPDPKVDAEMEKQKQEIQKQQQDLMKQGMDLQQKGMELAGREAELAQKGQEVSGQIKEAQAAIDMKVKETLSEQKISNQEFLLAMETRLSRHEMTMQKGMQQQKANFDKAQATRDKSALAAGKASEDKMMPVMKDMMDSHRQDMEELMKVLSAPVELTKDEKTGVKRARRVLQ